MRIPASILVLGLLLARAGVCQAQTTKQTDLTGFIRDTQDLATRIEAADATHAAAIAAEMPAAWKIRHGNDNYIIPTGWIAAPLRQAELHADDWTKTRTTLLERIKAMRNEAEWLDEDDGDRHEATTPKTPEARAALRDVLARSEFKQRDDASWTDETRRRFYQWLRDWLDRLPVSRGATIGVSETFAWIVAIGALIALVYYLLRSRLPRRSFTPLAIQPPPPTSAEWAARAYAALRVGDAREAMHCGYHAVLFRLEEQGVWHVDDARTPREYVRLLPAQDARRAAFIDLTRRFEQTWYGSRAADGTGLIENLEAFGCSAPSPSKPAI